MLEKPRRADKLAGLCAAHPALYLLLRVLAIGVVGLLLSVLADASVRLLALVARSPIALWIVTGEISSADERSVLIGGSTGLPWGGERAAILLMLTLLLVVAQVLCTWSGRSMRAAMLRSQRHGLPWPPHWELLRAPWLLRACGGLLFVAVSTAALIATSGLTRGIDWLYLPPVLIGLSMAALIVVPALDHGSHLLLQLLPTAPGGLRWADTRAADAAAHEHHRRRAEENRPPLPSFHLSASATAFLRPPPVTRRWRHRERLAEWTGTTTSIEALSAAVVVEALIEGESRGLLRVVEWKGGLPSISAAPPRGAQPQGLAAQVLGTHPVGLVDGETVAGPLSLVLDSFAGLDPHLNVLRVACSDLTTLGAARAVGTAGDRWCLKPTQLAALATPPQGPVLDAAGAPQLAAHRERLQAQVAKGLRRRRTTEASDEGLALLSAPFTMWSESAGRRAARLPGVCSTTPPG